MMNSADSGHGSPLWRMPSPSQEFEHGPRVEVAGRTVTLSYDYEAPSGGYGWESIVFEGVAAMAFTAREFCTEDQVGAYDKLLEIDNSAWLSALGARHDASGMRHLRIYFDGVGAFDLIATGFRPPPPRAVDDVELF